MRSRYFAWASGGISSSKVGRQHYIGEEGDGETGAQFLERNLSTILSADVAEFSRLMAEDEEQTLRVFRGICTSALARLRPCGRLLGHPFPRETWLRGSTGTVSFDN